MRTRLMFVPLLLAGCTIEVGIGDPPPTPDADAATAADDSDTEQLAAGDTDAATDSAIPVDTAPPADTDALPVTTCAPSDWVPSTFSFPPDALSCAGTQLVHFDATQGLWVGLVHCGGTAFRLYLSAAEAGPYLPALDLAGHGQDHCELIDPGFTIPNEDDITSGGCSACATSTNLPLEGVAGWARATFGTAFTYVASTGAWSWQTSRLDCDTDPLVCIPSP